MTFILYNKKKHLNLLVFIYIKRVCSWKNMWDSYHKHNGENRADFTQLVIHIVKARHLLTMISNANVEWWLVVRGGLNETWAYRNSCEIKNMWMFNGIWRHWYTSQRTSQKHERTKWQRTVTECSERFPAQRTQRTVEELKVRMGNCDRVKTV